MSFCTQVVTQNALCARILTVVTIRQFLVRLVHIETLRRGSLTVFIAGVLRSCGIKLDRVTPSKEMGTTQATKTFADGPPPIVRIENAVRPARQLQRIGLAVTEDAPWALQVVTEPLQGQICSSDAVVVPTALHGALDKRLGSRIASGCEIEVYAPVVFTVSLREAGVEKARVTAKARPGAQRA